MQSVHTLLLFILFSHCTLMTKLRYIFYCKTQFHAVYFNPPSLQTCKEYKKWTDYQVAIVTRSTVPPAPSIHLNTTRSIYYDTKYTHQVANNSSVYFLTFHYNPISFSYAHFRSSTLQYVQSQSSKNAHVYFSNISCHPLIIQSRPGSSRIFNQSILQDPQ